MRSRSAGSETTFPATPGSSCSHHAWQRSRATATLEGVTRLAFVAAVTIVVVSGCSRSGFDYVENQDEGVFIEIPDDWAVFEQIEIEPPPEVFADILFEPVEPQVEPWQVVLDAGPTPTASNIREPLYGFPIGLAEVQPIDQNVRDTFSTSTMRSLATQGEFDPALAPDGIDDVTVLLDVDVARDDLRGNRVVFSRPVADGRTIIDSLVFVDDLNSRWYRLTLSCEENCYRANAELINNVLNSFTVVR